MLVASGAMTVCTGTRLAGRAFAGLLLSLACTVPADAGWLAIANGSDEALGYASGRQTGADAANAALASCPSSNCRLVLVTEAACASYARPRPEHGGQARGFWFAYGANSVDVTRQSLSWCAQGTGDEFICAARLVGC